MKNNMTWNMKWLVWLLCGMGVPFLLLGTGACFTAARSGGTSMERFLDSGAFFYAVFGVFGMGLIVSGLILRRVMSKKEEQKRRLIEEGHFILADVVDVSQSYNIEINGRHPYVLRCSYGHPDGNTYIFKSGYLKYDPYLILRGGQVKVWVDREAMKNYYVDIEGSIQGRMIEL